MMDKSDIPYRDEDVPPRSDDVFDAEAIYRTYDPTPLNEIVESSVPSVFAGRRERITLDAGYANERLGLLIQWTKDISRTIDYLETREDIDADRNPGKTHV